MVRSTSGRANPYPSVVLLELNEAERHFVDALRARGRLPAFERIESEGARVRTRVPGWDAKGERSWRDISPWIVWPSVYTGLAPEEHGLVGFGQDTKAIRGRCVWDVLDARGFAVGVFGSLMSHPPRLSNARGFYVPEALANDAACLPEDARAVQEFALYTARNYSESFVAHALPAVWKLLRTLPAGVRLATVLRTLAQVPAELVLGPTREPERAMLQAYLQWDVFRRLWTRHRPDFACLNLNHVAYLQHRYWRAAEPQRFRDELSATDRRYFASVEERKRYEARLSGRIAQGFAWTDGVLGDLMELLPEGGVLLVASGLGQRPMDPVHEIHNPVVRLVQAEQLFARLGLAPFRVLHQMNPDLTVDFADEGAAAQAAERFEGLRAGADEPLFRVQRRGRQVFLELDVPSGTDPDGRARIRHAAFPELEVDLERHLVRHRSNDQSTAHHKDAGLLLAWRKGGALEAERTSIPITDVAPTILSLFGVEPQAWMHPSGPPAIRLVPASRAARAEGAA